MKDFMKVSPLKILEKSSEKALGRGNLGVLMARAGVGKTACLIHIALDRLFREKRLVHICLEDTPEKVRSYYNVILSDLVEVSNVADDETRGLVEKNRMILAYLNRSFEIRRLRENLKNLVEKVHFVPETLIVDGLDFEAADRKLFEDFKGIASQYHVEIWFSALSHRHITDVNEEGIPYPCNKLDDLFNIIAVLEPASSGILLRLLKDHGKKIMDDAFVNLDPKTFLAVNP
jgi:hypothetical protein